MKQISVIKRDGNKELFDFDKINIILKSACKKFENTSPEEIVKHSQIQFSDGMETYKIHDILIHSAAELISEDIPEYQYVAAHLLMYKLRKEVYGSQSPKSIVEQLYDNKNLYHDSLFTEYDVDDYEFFNNHIVHERDYNFNYLGLRTYIDKQCLQNRGYKTNKQKRYRETPQITYMIMFMYGFANIQDKQLRRELIIKAYDFLSLEYLSFPTPLMIGCRTKSPQNSSCAKIKIGDSLPSICASVTAITKYIAAKAGLGVNVGSIRPALSPVRNGESLAAGLIPYIRLVQAAVKSTSQQGVRSGSATLFCPIWHLEIEDYIVLKNNRGTEFNRARHLDYAVSWNNYLLNRAINKQPITLFSPQLTDLYDSFFSKDARKFIELYEHYEKCDDIPKKVVDGYELLVKWVNERFETRRNYFFHAQNVNYHTPFLDQIEQSNLCMEIAIPNHHFESEYNDELGEISLCTLSGINVGKNDILEKMPDLMYILVKLLNELLIKQQYASDYARRNTEKYNPLGIGVINYAYFLAKNYEQYGSKGGLKLTHELFESMYYNALKASVECAKDYGKCSAFDKTIYAQGKTLLDTYNKNVDELGNFELLQDWDSLKKEISIHGLRNATLLAQFPSETSAKITGSTFGVEPVRNVMYKRKDQDTNEKFIAPESKKLKYWYDLPFSTKDFTSRYIKNIAIMQKFICQAISANTYYDPTLYDDGKVPITDVINDIFEASYYGVKTLYYSNLRDVAGDSVHGKEETCDGCVV